MSLENEYKRILDEAFAKHFSGWDSLSPLDPVKVLSEAMTGSLGQIERRQRQYVSALMDSLPSLCGLTPKGAELPIALLRFSPAARLSEVKTLPSGAAFRFHKDEVACDAVADASFRISPIYDFASRTDGTKVTLDFRYQGIASDLVLAFVPGAQASGAALSVARLEVDGKVVDARVSENTSGFRRFGYLTFEAVKRGDLLFPEANQTVRVTLELDRAASGNFVANVAPFRLVQYAEPLALGYLTGEPWEEVALPENVVAAPAECYLSFSDERTRSLVKQESSLLEIKEANYEAFRGSYFYNGANHSIVVPAADELIGNYNGRVQLFARVATLRPSFDTLAVDLAGRVGEYAGIVEKVTAHAALSTYVPRETKRSYLARFYGAMATLQKQASPALNAHDVQQQLLSSEKDLRAVETEFDLKENTLAVYLLATNPGDADALRLSSELVGRVASKLGQILPLNIRWQIRPFRSVPVTLSLQASAVTGPGFADAGQARETLAQGIKAWLRPYPFGQLRVSTQYPLSELARPLGLRSLGGAVAKNGMVAGSLLRGPGEIFEADLQVQVSLFENEVSHVA